MARPMNHAAVGPLAIDEPLDQMGERRGNDGAGSDAVTVAPRPRVARAEMAIGRERERGEEDHLLVGEPCEHAETAFDVLFRMSRDETGGGNVEARGRQMDRWRQYGKGSASHLDRIQCAGPDRSGASLG